MTVHWLGASYAESALCPGLMQARHRVLVDGEIYTVWPKQLADLRDGWTPDDLGITPEEDE